MQVSIFAIALLTFTVMFQVSVRADPKWIFKLNASSCRTDPNQRSFTGFRSRGVYGIVTALHGVAGCEALSAISADNSIVIQDLRIAAVDFEYDVAVLESREAETGPPDGLVPGTSVNPGEILRIWGFPYD